MELLIYQHTDTMFLRMLGDIMKVCGPQQQSVHTIRPFTAVSGNIQCFVLWACALLKISSSLNPITI
jgi:hypothetical protein